MSKLITTNFSVLLAQQYSDTLGNTSGTGYTYAFIGRPYPFADDNNPPTPVDNYKSTHIDVYKEMIAAKLITEDDTSVMMPRNDWVINTVYDQYQDDASTNLFDGRKFYVGVQEGDNYNVFKCLRNAGGAQSTFAPSLDDTSADDELYYTADGYQWKYMFTINNVDMDKFASALYVPVRTNANVAANAVSGSIDTIHVTFRGSDYVAHSNGVFQQTSIGGNNSIHIIEADSAANNDFYNNSAIKITSGTGSGQQRTIADYIVTGSTKTIVLDEPFTTNPDTSSAYEISPNVIMAGDGQGFRGRALVNAAASNSVYSVEITNRGNTFHYATASLAGNTGGVSNTAILDPVISPHGGHGAKPAEELGGRYVCVSATFTTQNGSSDGKLFDVNDFRTVGLIRSPQFANVHIDVTDFTGSFAVGDTITQYDTGATGTLVSQNTTIMALTNVNKWFMPGNSTFRVLTNGSSNAQAVAVRNNGSANIGSAQTSILMEYADQTKSWDVSSVSGSGFVDDEVIYTTNTATQNAYLYSANSSVIRAVDIRGAFGTEIRGATSDTVATVSANNRPGDFVLNSGEVIYIQNMSPVTRDDAQKETIKLIFKV